MTAASGPKVSLSLPQLPALPQPPSGAIQAAGYTAGGLAVLALGAAAVKSVAGYLPVSSSAETAAAAAATGEEAGGVQAQDQPPSPRRSSAQDQLAERKVEQELDAIRSKVADLSGRKSVMERVREDLGGFSWFGGRGTTPAAAAPVDAAAQQPVRQLSHMTPPGPLPRLTSSTSSSSCCQDKEPEPSSEQEPPAEPAAAPSRSLAAEVASAAAEARMAAAAVRRLRPTSPLPAPAPAPAPAPVPSFLEFPSAPREEGSAEPSAETEASPATVFGWEVAVPALPPLPSPPSPLVLAGQAAAGAMAAGQRLLGGSSDLGPAVAPPSPPPAAAAAGQPSGIAPLTLPELLGVSSAWYTRMLLTWMLADGAQQQQLVVPPPGPEPSAGQGAVTGSGRRQVLPDPAAVLFRPLMLSSPDA